MPFNFNYHRIPGEDYDAFIERAMPGFEMIHYSRIGELRVFRASNEHLGQGWQRTTIIIDHKPE